MRAALLPRIIKLTRPVSLDQPSMVLNRQNRYRIQRSEIEKYISQVRRVLKVGRREITVCFVGNAEIARLNRRFRRKPKPTDVLSFPTDGLDRSQLGDIAISPEAASRNAKRFGRSLGDELRVLILHGTLHLLGYDHETDSGTMERKELRLRRKFGLK